MLPGHVVFGPGALCGDAGEGLSDDAERVFERPGAVFESWAAVFAAGSLLAWWGVVTMQVRSLIFTIMRRRAWRPLRVFTAERPNPRCRPL
jgi:hypothetical protein